MYNLNNELFPLLYQHFRISMLHEDFVTSVVILIGKQNAIF